MFYSLYAAQLRFHLQSSGTRVACELDVKLKFRNLGVFCPDEKRIEWYFSWKHLDDTNLINFFTALKIYFIIYSFYSRQ